MAGGTLALTPPIEKALLKLYVLNQALTADETNALATIPGSRTCTVALFSTFGPRFQNPTGTELAGSGYARQSVTFVAATAPPYKRVRNSAAVTFTNSSGSPWVTANWLVITHTGGGAIIGLAYMALSPGITLAAGASITIPQYGLTITID